ncbi:MAG: gamma carbonic anhydrase family protein [Chromatiales bacterium]|jgi:carbonic anhydrase/acetyltransferase-like protein (isoleucine patch superfamily)
MKNIRPFENHHPQIADDAWIDPSAVVIGDTHIGSGSSVWPNVTIRGDIHKIRIGDNTNIQDNSLLHISHDSKFLPGGAPLIVGNFVTVGHLVTLHGCQIGDYCLIGMGSIILDNAVLDSNVMVGAGSLVPGGKKLESGFLYLGSPAKKVRELKDEELEFLEYSAEHYRQLAIRHRNST